MTEKKSSDIADEAKGLAQDFVGTLGLLELMLGGIAMYGIRLLYGPQITPMFPSTGITFVDVGLLALGAALVGSIVELLIAVLMAIGILIIANFNLLKYRGRIEDALQEVGLLKPPDQESPGVKKDPVDFALYYVVSNDATQQVYFERLRTKIVLAYSASILVIPYVIHFWREGAQTGIQLLAVLGAPILLLRGFAGQLDFFKSLADRLEVLQKHKTQAGTCVDCAKK
ncbi:MAG: hypothetical protein AABN34_04270 [Acidobacteriota bacterium]